MELLLRPDGVEELRVLQQAVDWTRVHLRMPVDGQRLRGRLAGELPEVALLADRCQYSSVPVLVNGLCLDLSCTRVLQADAFETALSAARQGHQAAHARYNVRQLLHRRRRSMVEGHMRGC